MDAGICSDPHPINYSGNVDSLYNEETQCNDFQHNINSNYVFITPSLFSTKLASNSYMYVISLYLLVLTHCIHPFVTHSHNTVDLETQNTCNIKVNM